MRHRPDTDALMTGLYYWPPTKALLFGIDLKCSGTTGRTGNAEIDIRKLLIIDSLKLFACYVENQKIIF